MAAEPDAVQSRKLPNRAAFFLALIAAPLIIGGCGLGLMGLGEQMGRGDAAEAVRITGLIAALSVPFGGLSYAIVGGVMFWRKHKRAARRIVDFVITAFLANFIAALIAFPLVSFFGVVSGAREPMSFGTLALVVHGFGLIFAPLYGLIFGFVFTRTARDLGAPPLPSDTVEAVFR